MKYITKRDSETGKKFAEICKLSDNSIQARKLFLRKIGAKKFRPSRHAVYGGISSLCFPPTIPVDTKVFKKIATGEYMPRLNNKEGKAIQAEIDALPIVTVKQLNACIGFKETWLKTIGFAPNNKEYFGFVVGEDWGIKIPADCEEVTASKYKELFAEKE